MRQVCNKMQTRHLSKPFLRPRFTLNLSKIWWRSTPKNREKLKLKIQLINNK
jgi:hypothetical protein